MPARPLILLTALVGSLLGAQDPVLLRFEGMTKNLRSNLVVILDGPKGELKKEAERLTQEPDWIELELRVAFYSAEAPKIEQALKEKAPQVSRPGWVLMGPGAKVVAAGSRLPSRAAMEQLLEEAGIRSRSKILRDFLRTHPGHLEAKSNLIGLLMSKAATATQAKLGLRQEPLHPVDKPFDPSVWAKEQEERQDRKEREEKEKKPLKELQTGEDLLIWSEVAEQVDRIFRSGEWRSMEMWSTHPNEAARHSPIMKEVIRRGMPEVEDALQGRPTDWGLWSLWLAMSDALGGRPLMPLVESLSPSPLQDPDGWPPEAVKSRYLKDAKARQDWQAIRDLLLPEWERQRVWESQIKGSYQYVEDGKVKANPWEASTWRERTEPLVEALLRLGESTLADKVVRSALAKNPWDGLTAKASALALRCNQPALAAAWAALSSDRPR